MPIIVGGVIEKDNKYLLVQESKPKCYGKWNIPAGHLDPGESIFDGAKREIKEETNCDVELTGVCNIGNHIVPNDTFVAIVFTTKLLTDTVKPQAGEILEAKWFTYEEIVAMSDQLRRADWIISAIDFARRGAAPLDLVRFSETEVK
jgi:ADP-ribose pyrophosphatase YjhB (NUDIX family)